MQLEEHGMTIDHTIIAQYRKKTWMLVMVCFWLAIKMCLYTNIDFIEVKQCPKDIGYNQNRSTKFWNFDPLSSLTNSSLLLLFTWMPVMDESDAQNNFHHPLESLVIFFNGLKFIVSAIVLSVMVMKCHWPSELEGILCMHASYFATLPSATLTSLWRILTPTQ